MVHHDSICGNTNVPFSELHCNSGYSGVYSIHILMHQTVIAIEIL